MQLDPIGILFSKSWRRYQERFAVLTSIFLVPLALIGIGELLITRQTILALALGGVINLLGGIISVAASLAMVAAIGGNEDFAASYRTGFKLFWASVWIAILASLASFGGLILFVVPGIILAVQLALVRYALVLEGKNGMDALAQSREYVKGYWWAFVGRGLLLGLLFGAIMLVLYLPFKLIAGGIEAGLIYGILLLLFAPFSAVYSYEIFDNLRRLKPNAAEAAAKTEKGFLKVCMVVGVVGIIGVIILLFAALAFLPAAIMKWSAMHPGGYNYAYSPSSGTSTLPGEGQVRVSPATGPVGTLVTISGPVNFDATNTIFMNGYVAVRDVSPSADGMLSFKIPASLLPNCDPHEMCPQFVLPVRPGMGYGVAVTNSQGIVSAGTFTVASQ